MRPRERPLQSPTTPYVSRGFVDAGRDERVAASLAHKVGRRGEDRAEARAGPPMRAYARARLGGTVPF